MSEVFVMTAAESNAGVFDALMNSAPSPCVTIAYRLSQGSIKVLDMGYTTDTNYGDTPTKKQVKEQFRRGCMRVNDNLLAGQVGYVRDGNGDIYQVARESKTATRYWIRKEN